MTLTIEPQSKTYSREFEYSKWFFYKNGDVLHYLLRKSGNVLLKKFEKRIEHFFEINTSTSRVVPIHDIDAYIDEHVKWIQDAADNYKSSLQCISAICDMIGDYCWNGRHECGWRLESDSKAVSIYVQVYESTIHLEENNCTSLISLSQLENWLHTNKSSFINTLKVNKSVTQNVTRQTPSKSTSYYDVDRKQTQTNRKDLIKRYSNLFISFPKTKRIQYQTCKEYVVDHNLV